MEEEDKREKEKIVSSKFMMRSGLQKYASSYTSMYRCLCRREQNNPSQVKGLLKHIKHLQAEVRQNLQSMFIHQLDSLTEMLKGRRWYQLTSCCSHRKGQSPSSTVIDSIHINTRNTPYRDGGKTTPINHGPSSPESQKFVFVMIPCVFKNVFQDPIKVIE